MSISKRIGSISPSVTLAISAKAKQMKAEGINIIGFGAGEHIRLSYATSMENITKGLDRIKEFVAKIS